MMVPSSAHHLIARLPINGGIEGCLCIQGVFQSISKFCRHAEDNMRHTYDIRLKFGLTIKHRTVTGLAKNLSLRSTFVYSKAVQTTVNPRSNVMGTGAQR